MRLETELWYKVHDMMMNVVNLIPHFIKSFVQLSNQLPILVCVMTEWCAIGWANFEQ